jgi:hypothetical protein
MMFGSRDLLLRSSARPDDGNPKGFPMRKFSILMAAVAAVALFGLPSTGHAQGVYIGPGGVTVDPGFRRDDPRPRRAERIGRREAVEIAREHGLVDVRDVDSRGDEYVVRGEDRRGNRMRVVVDAWNGRVLDIARRD